jgi:hypothetical protein
LVVFFFLLGFGAGFGSGFDGRRRSPSCWVCGLLLSLPSLISVVGDVRGDRGRVDDDKEEEDELDADEAVLEEVEDER